MDINENTYDCRKPQLLFKHNTSKNIKFITRESLNKNIYDTRGRQLRDLRISITDRCNFRCSYCMPKEVFNHSYKFFHHDQLLSFEEIERLAKIFVSLGVKKIHLTGGEPLLRQGVENLIERLSTILEIDLALTTNGMLLEKKAHLLRDAGLKRITVSLDSLDSKVFEKMNDVGVSVDHVLSGIEAAEAVGFKPIKINMVVKRGINDQSIVPMARHFRRSGHIVRFIEYMDVGHTNGWKMEDVVPASELIALIDEQFPLEPMNSIYPGEVANRWRYRDGNGEIGIIASVTQPFCGDCTRLRLSPEGSLYTCLFATSGYDLRKVIRNGATDKEIISKISKLWHSRNDRYSEIRSNKTIKMPKIEMSYIGG